MRSRIVSPFVLTLVAVLCCPAVHAAPKASPKRPTILLYGDSLCSEGSEFYLAMRRQFPQVDIHRSGIIGASTWERAESFPDPDKWPDRPDLVIVLMGVNDPGHDRDHRPEQGWADLPPWQRKASDKAVERYTEVQEKKWRRWNEAMFER